MLKDYVNIKQAHAVPKKPKRWPALLILCLIALGLVTTLGYQLHQYWRQHQIMKPKATVIQIKTKQAAKPAPTTTHFEFYTLLSKQPVPQAITTADNSNKAEAAITPINNTDKAIYQLQAASLQNRIDAQAFARQLLALGYQSKIRPYLHDDGTTWYRVIIGPLNNVASAKQMQANLQQHHIDSLLSRIQ